MERNKRSARRRTTHYLTALSDRGTNTWESFTAKAALKTFGISSICKAVSSNTMLFECQNNFVACHGRLRQVFLRRSMRTFCKVSVCGQKQCNSDMFVANSQHDCSIYTLLQLRQKLGEATQFYPEFCIH